MRNIWTFFSLTPHNANLRSGQTLRWIGGAAVIITLMASTEGFIWGSLFNFYFEETVSPVYRYTLCFTISAFVFMLLWVIDSSFITLDTTKNPLSENNKWYKPERRQVLYMLGIAIRIIIIGISLYVTVPAVTKLSVSKDIDKIIEDENNIKKATIIETINKKHTDVNEKYDKLMLQTDSLIIQKSNELTKEIAGKGVSGNYGDKVVANSIRENIALLEKRKRELIESRKKEHNAINTEAENISKLPHERLTEKYGIKFLSKTAGEVEKIVAEMEKDESYKNVEKISRAYVSILFIALLLLKFFSPRSVKIYLNEELQDLYKSYIEGLISDQYLNDLQQLTKDVKSKNITPYIFEDFWYRYKSRRQNELRFSERDKKLKELEEKLSKLQKQKIEIENELEPAEKEYLDLSKDIIDLEQQLALKRIEEDTFKSQLSEINERINYLNSNKHELRPEDLIQLSKSQKELETKLATVQANSRRITADITLANDKKELEKERLTLIKSELQTVRKNLENLYALKGRLRDEYFKDIEDGIKGS